MTEAKFNRLCEIINNRITENRNISDEQLHEYLSAVYKIICSNGLFPTQFALLRKKFVQKWNCGQLYTQNTMMPFMMGAVFSGVVFSILAQEERERLPKLEDAAQSSAVYFDLMNLVHQNPGIKHSVLAKQLGKSPSHLSQLMDKKPLKEYFSSTRLGREKYYYIEQYGEEVLAEIKRRQENVLPSLYDADSRKKAASEAQKIAEEFGDLSGVKQVNVLYTESNKELKLKGNIRDGNTQTTIEISKTKIEKRDFNLCNSAV